MRMALLALLWLLAPVANAAPALIAAGMTAAAAATVVAVVQIALTIGMAVYGAAQQKSAERKAARAAEQQKAEYNASLKDRTITNVATESPYVYVYGEARVGSAIVGIFASGGNDEYKHLVCIHAAHECEEIREVYINGIALGTLNGAGEVTGGQFLKVTTESYSERILVEGVVTRTLPDTVIISSLAFSEPYNALENNPVLSIEVVGNLVTFTSTGSLIDISYQYVLSTPMVRVKKHLGTPDDPADTSLLTEVPSLWKSTSVLRGFCYTVVRLNLNQPEFQGGLPTVEVKMKGKKLYDFRTDTTAWSNNPVLATYDYMISEICGISPEDIPVSQYIAAANVCDEELSFGKRYTLNGTVTGNQSQAQVLEQFAQSMAGSIVSTTWAIRAGKYVAPVMAIQQEDIIGSIGVTPGMSDTDTFNSVRGQFISPENTYVSTDYKPYQNLTLLAADGREIWSDIDLPFTDSLQRVHNLCRIFMERNRSAYTVKGDFSLKTWKLQIGDRCTLNSPYFGWDNKIFEVTDKRYAPNGAVELTLKEDAESIWDEADQAVPDATPNSNLPNPFTIAKIASVTCESGTGVLQISTSGEVLSRISVTWPLPTDITTLTNGLVDVEWQELGKDAWERTTVNVAQGQVYLLPVIDGVFYNVRVRAVEPYFNVKSDWTYAEIHQVLGKSEPPPNIIDFNISGNIITWTPVVALDLKGYIFKFQYGTNLDWNSATPLHEGIITETPYNLLTRPSGAVTIMGKAIDTSDNESLVTASIFTDLGDAPIQNVVEEIDFDALSYPGTINGGSLIGEDLLADELDSFYGTANQSFYTSELDSFYEDSTYAQLIYTTDVITVSSALAGSIMTIVSATTGTDLVIEYRYPDSTPFYGLDSESFYGLDPNPFYEGIQGAWLPWPGQIFARNDAYQFRITLGAGAVRATISEFAVVIDAPDIIEYIDDLVISSLGTDIPYTKTFNVIKNVQATLQANGSGAETIEVDKTINLTPKIKAYNSSHVAVSGATSDITIRGY